MPKNFLTPLIVSTLIMPLVATPALAGGNAPQQQADAVVSQPVDDGHVPIHERFFDNFSRVAIGAAVVSSPEFIGSDKDDVDYFPIIQGQYNLTDKDAIYFRGLRLGYAHAFSKHVQFGVDTTVRGSRNEDDDARLNGMGDIDTAFEVGPWVKARLYGFSLKSDIMFDVSGEHSGYVANIKVGRHLERGKNTSLELYGETSWGSGDFMDTYFTVLPGQAIAGRPAFNASSGLYQSAVGATLQQSLSEKIYLRLDTKLSFLHGDAKDTALTYNNNNLHGFLALGYAF